MNRTLYRLHSTRDVTRKICLLEEILSDSVRCKGNLDDDVFLLLRLEFVSFFFSFIFEFGYLTEV